MPITSIILVVARYALTRIADIGCRVLSFQGEDMAHTDTCAKPEPAQPIVDVSDIDEALAHTSLVQHRDEHWHRWADALLDQRNRLEAQAKKTSRP